MRLATGRDARDEPKHGEAAFIDPAFRQADVDQRAQAGLLRPADLEVVFEFGSAPGDARLAEQIPLYPVRRRLCAQAQPAPVAMASHRC